MLLLIKKYKEALEAVKKYISYLPIESKKKIEKKNIFLWIEKCKDGFHMISIL